MDKYQKIKDLGLTIDSSYHAANGCHENVVNADKLLKVLDAGVEVMGSNDGQRWMITDKTNNAKYSALLINIKELKLNQVTITREDLDRAWKKAREGSCYIDPDKVSKELGL